MKDMLEREGYTDTFVTDIPFSRVNAFKQAVISHRSGELFGAGSDAGTLALFGSPNRFEGRDVTGYSMSGLGSVPYEIVRGFTGSSGGVNWDRTEKINRVPLQEIDPRGLMATQQFVTHGGMYHYLNDTTGSLYADQFQASNQFPAIFEDADTGERRILTGHHRATAALIQGNPVLARLVRGHLNR